MDAEGSRQTPQHQFYVAGGTLPPDSPSYVGRKADTQLLQALQELRLCYVLNARQMGKSSLCARARRTLEAQGTRTVWLDLQKFGSSATAEQWYRSLLDRLGHDIKLRSSFLSYWRESADRAPLERLFGALRDVALEQIDDPIVIFIDEIDVVRDLGFSTDEFFGAIRHCHNARVEDPAYGRLTFCIIGTVAPTDLIRDVRLSPFNIGERVRLEDFTAAEAAPLSGPLPGGGKTLDRVLWWTEGHPYLTQRLCAELTHSGSVDVDGAVSRLFFAKSDSEVDENVKNVRNVVLRMGGEGAGFDRVDLLTRYGEVVSGRRVLDDDTDGVCTALRLSGLVRSEGGFLRPRCRIYAKVFDGGWVREHLPDGEVRRQRAAAAKARWQVGSIAAVVLGVVLSVVILMMGALAGWAVKTGNDARLAEAAADRAAIRLARSASLHLAQLAIDGNNFPLAGQLMEAMKTFPERHHDWEHLHKLLNVELLQLTGHEKAVTSVAFSPDGRRVLTGGIDGTARLWDSSTGRQMLILRGHRTTVTSVSFSPDGKRILTGSWDTTARVWDASTGMEVMQLPGHIIKATSVAFSPDGRRIVTSSANHTVRVWDASTGRELLVFKVGTSGNSVSSVCFSPDARRIVTGSWDNTARVIDAFTGKELMALKGHTGAVASIGFSPDGRHILTGGDTTARVWNAATGRVERMLKGHGDLVTAVAFSPDGRRIVTGSSDRTARVWDAATGRVVLILEGHKGLAVTSVAFSQDGRRIVTGGDDATARVWGGAGRAQRNPRAKGTMPGGG